MIEEMKRVKKQELRPREIGKVHRHEKVVRPIFAEKLVHKNPLKDMYQDPERDHLTLDIDLPIRCFNIHVTQSDPEKSTRLHKHHNEAVIYIIEGKGYSIIQGKDMIGSKAMRCTSLLLIGMLTTIQERGVWSLWGLPTNGC